MPKKPSNRPLSGGLKNKRKPGAEKILPSVSSRVKKPVTRRSRRIPSTERMGGWMGSRSRGITRENKKRTIETVKRPGSVKNKVRK